jgi:putative nucleotidyltransferase with HDIG domain
MFDSIRRAKLQREGLSCGKIRRKHQEGDMMDVLRTHPAVMIGLGVAFVAVVVVLMGFGAKVTEGLPQPGFLIYSCAAALVTAMVIHLRVGLRELLVDNRTFALALGVLAMHLAVMVAILDFGYRQGWTGVLLVLSLPHAAAPLILSVMLGRRAGLFAALYGAMFGVLIAVSVSPLTFLAVSILIGFLSVALTRRVRKRSRLFKAGLYLGVVAAAFSVMLHQASASSAGLNLTSMVGVPFLAGLLTGMIVSGMLPVLESLFGVTTEISWLELSDLNHPLLRRLSIEAPGSYHHSLMVASLAESAAEAIGANATMCRVCSYFHDIGKLTKPEYFIENSDPEHNPHNDLTARMSALVLIAHVKDGVDLGIKHNLNCQILDVIEQHHGTTLTYFFYKKALEQRAEQLKQAEQAKTKEDDVPQVSEDVFRYPGPKPQFKEAAIISLADAVESASRSIDKPSALRIDGLINAIVQHRVAEGQLDECDLTIAELAKVKASFGKSLLSMMHGRIRYGHPASDGAVENVGARQGALSTSDVVVEASFPLQGARRRQGGAENSGGGGKSVSAA